MRKAALGSGIFIILADDTDAAIKRFLLHLDDGDGHPSREEIHCDTATHSTSTNHADFFDIAKRRILRQTVNLCGLAFGKEHVTLGGRLAAHHQFHELGALKRHAFIKGQPRSRLNTGKIGIWRVKALPLLRVRSLQLLNHTDIAFDGQIARGAWPLGNTFARKGNRVFGKACFARKRIN